MFTDDAALLDVEATIEEAIQKLQYPINENLKVDYTWRLNAK